MKYSEYINKYKTIGILDYTDSTFLLNYKGSIVQLDRIKILLEFINDPEFTDLCYYNFPILADIDNIDDLDQKVIDDYQIVLSGDQEKATRSCCKFIIDPDKNTFGLYGSAGSGKTTVISHFIKYLITNEYVNKIAVTAPTNQALKVLESKVDIQHERICYKTIQSAMGYIKHIDNNNNLTFVRGAKTPNISKLYDIVFIDECSMLSKEIFNHIMELKNCKIIFVGDIAQLPPVNEVNSLTFSVIKDTIIMKAIMRNNFNDVIGLCNEIRDWVMNVNNKPNISKHILKTADRKVFAYRHDPKLCKISSVWFKTAQKYNEIYKNVSNVILAWTNAQCDEYNNTMREKSKEEFNKNDLLIFTSYYIKDIKYHSSCQVRVIRTAQTSVTVPMFSNIIEYKDLNNMDIIQNIYNNTIAIINSVIKRTYKVWTLSVTKIITELNIIPDNSIHDIIVIKNTNQHVLIDDKDKSSKQIKELLKTYQQYFKNNPELLTNIENHVIKPLWIEWNKRFDDPFASVNSAFSITVHKSQGITCYNVFVDGNNILRNPNSDESKRCLYTAITRGSNTLHLLM